MTLETWLYFCATELVLSLSPGPAVLLVVSQAASGVRPALAASAGVLLANALYFALSAIGVGAALAASHELFLALKWLGVAYLVWFGARAVLKPKQRSEGAPASERRVARPLAHGFVMQAASPKVLLFFTALLPQFVTPAAPVAPQIALLGASSIVIELAVLSVYAVAAARTSRALRQTRFATSLDRAGGILLLGAAAGLATLRRTP
jgi:homoserine/homoserine lactone efflux protein